MVVATFRINGTCGGIVAVDKIRTLRSNAFNGKVEKHIKLEGKGIYMTMFVKNIYKADKKSYEIIVA